MVEFRKRKSDGQAFPVQNNNGMTAMNPSNEVGGLSLGKGIKVPLNVEEPLEEKNTERKIQALTRKLESGDVVVTEREINFIKNTLNRTPRDEWRMGEGGLREATWSRTDLNRGFRITEEQNEKGLKFLQKNRNKLSARELGVVEDFKEFRFEGIVETHSGTEIWIPVWRVFANDGESFQYRVQPDEGIEITG